MGTGGGGVQPPDTASAQLTSLTTRYASPATAALSTQATGEILN